MFSLIASFILIMGIVFLSGSILNWDFIVNSPLDHRLNPTMGRMGIRIFYGILGFLVTMIGVFSFFAKDFLKF